MKTQTFGIEIETTGLGRRRTAEAIARFFGTTARYIGNHLDNWEVDMPDGRHWGKTGRSGGQKGGDGGRWGQKSPLLPRKRRATGLCWGENWRKKLGLRKALSARI